MRRALILIAAVCCVVVGLYLAGLFVASPHSPYSKLLVLESSVSAVKVGAEYSPTDTITVPPGAAIRVVSPSGKTQTIVGPYSGPIGDRVRDRGGNGGVSAWLKNLLSTGGSVSDAPRAKKVAEEAKKGEEEAKRAAEAKRLTEAKAAEERKTEEAARAVAEAKKAAEARRLTAAKAAEERKTAEAARAMAEAMKAAEAKRLTAAKAAEERRAAEEPSEAGKDAEAKKAAEPPISNPCSKQGTCTLVPVFFGTDRKRLHLSHRIDFGPDRAYKLQFGQAFVTVPKVRHRRVGEILRPTALEAFFRLTPAQGDASKHFTILPGGVRMFATADDFFSAVREHMIAAGDFKDHAFIFVHGYSTTFEYALYRVAQIAYDLAGSDGRPFGTAFLYSWPSGGDYIAYPYDAESARYSIPHVRKYIELVLDRSGAKHVHLIAHSMGNSALLAALSEIAQSARKPTTIDQIILAAPDYDTEQFAKVVEQIVPIARGITLYASSNDVAMIAARTAYRGVYRAGDVPDGGPVVVRGMDTIDVSAVNMDGVTSGHADYVERRELMNDIALLLQRGERPPHMRTPMFKLIESDNRKFWRVRE